MRKGSIIEGIGGRPADGDTFVLENEHGKWDIRVYGIDAAEHGQFWFFEAQEYLRKLVHRKKLYCQVIQKDCYGRFVCRVTTESGLDVALEMLATGMAWYYSPKGNEKEYWETAVEAMNNRVGQWQNQRLEPPYKYRERQKIKDSNKT